MVSLLAIPRYRATIESSPSSGRLVPGKLKKTEDGKVNLSQVPLDFKMSFFFLSLGLKYDTSLEKNVHLQCHKGYCLTSTFFFLNQKSLAYMLQLIQLTPRIAKNIVTSSTFLLKANIVFHQKHYHNICS